MKKRLLQKIPERNKMEIYQNYWDTANVVLTRKFTVINAHLKKKEKSQIINLIVHLTELRKKKKSPKLVERRNKD